MGCNQATPALATEPSVVQQIPCTQQEIGLYLNDIRENPKKYADLLEKQLQKFTDEYSIMILEDVLYRTNQGRFCWKDAIDFLRNIDPLPPLKLHSGLCKAAKQHAVDLSRRSQLTHKGLDGSQPLDRMVKYCKKGFGKTGQNIGTDFKLQNRNYAQNTILGLVIDDGVSDRGHRLSIFDKDFSYYGSASRIQGDRIITVINYLSQDWPSL